MGAMMFEMITGKDPFFEASSVFELIQLHVNTPPPALLDVHPGARFTPRLEAVIRKAMQKDPAERFQTAQQLQEALMVACSGTQGSVDKYFLHPSTQARTGRPSSGNIPQPPEPQADVAAADFFKMALNPMGSANLDDLFAVSPQEIVEPAAPSYAAPLDTGPLPNTLETPADPDAYKWGPQAGAAPPQTPPAPPAPTPAYDMPVDRGLSGERSAVPERTSSGAMPEPAPKKPSQQFDHNLMEQVQQQSAKKRPTITREDFSASSGPPRTPIWPIVAGGLMLILGVAFGWPRIAEVFQPKRPAESRIETTAPTTVISPVMQPGPETPLPSEKTPSKASVTGTTGGVARNLPNIIDDRPAVQKPKPAVRRSAPAPKRTVSAPPRAAKPKSSKPAPSANRWDDLLKKKTQ